MINLNIHLTLKSPFIAAASGLVITDKFFLMVADDENHMARFDRTSLQGEYLEIFPDQLPTEPKARKKIKPDFESLIDCPSLQRLLVMPSGSTSQRMRAAWLAPSGELLNHWNLSDFFLSLNPYISEINIEGGVFFDQELLLFQRGNGEKGENGLIYCELTSLQTLKFKAYKPIQLPLIQGVATTFTDACRYQDQLLFVAVAEDSQSTYLDGEVKGSLIGLMGHSGEVLKYEILNTLSKPEGIFWDGIHKKIYLVTDDDDRKKPSQLLWGEWKALV